MNPTQEIFIEKVVLNIGSTGEKLERGYKLLQRITGRKPMKVKVQRKRIPTWGVRPGLEVGAFVTVRKGYEELLKRLLVAVENKLRKKQIAVNHFSFGLKEYIEIPGIEYQRDIGIMGFDVIVVFSRQGRRISTRSLKKTPLPKKQYVSKEEIIKYMEDHFKTTFR